jgi:hypothetical protein
MCSAYTYSPTISSLGLSATKVKFIFCSLRAIKKWPHNTPTSILPSRQLQCHPNMREELRIIFDKHFRFLTADYGYTVESSTYEQRSFGNFGIELTKGQKKIKIISDRSQIFVDVFDAKLGWVDKNEILEKKGILRTRFNTTNGLWEGYEIQNVVNDLKRNRSILDI